MNTSNDMLTAAQEATIRSYEVEAEVAFADLVKYQVPGRGVVDVMKKRQQVFRRIHAITERVTAIRRHARASGHQSLAQRLAEFPETGVHLIVGMLKRIDELEQRIAALEGKDNPDETQT